MKINLRHTISSDPRLGLDDEPDPRWWDKDDTEERPSGRTGYGHEAQLPPESTGTNQRESIEDLYDAALAGFLPRSRSLKAWEPDKLNARHLQIINLKAAGLSNKRIAEMVDVTETTVSITINHPDAQYILARIIAYAAENVVDMDARIKATAPLAHERLLETLLTTKKEETIIKIGFGFLDRAGYGVTQKLESKQTVTLNVPSEHASLLKAAIEEARLPIEADYVILDGQPGSPDSFGSEGGPPQAFEPNGAAGSGTPSSGGSQVPLLPPAKEKVA